MLFLLFYLTSGELAAHQGGSEVAAGWARHHTNYCTFLANRACVEWQPLSDWPVLGRTALLLNPITSLISALLNPSVLCRSRKHSINPG